MAAAELGLVGDVGATNARFALVRPDGHIAWMSPSHDDGAALHEVIEQWLG